jgi:DNA-3-methyladenine glycosylase II
MFTSSGQIKPVAPFDFSQSLRFVGEFMPTQHEQVVGNLSMTKSLSIDGLPVAFKLTSTGTIDQPTLDYTLYAEQPLSLEHQHTAIDKISFYLSLNDDLNPFYAIGQDDACFAPVIEQLYGFHQVKFSVSLFEHACWSILTQRNYISIARKMKDALIARYGSRIAVDGTILPIFPEARAIVEAGEAELISVIRHQQKANYLSGVARAFLDVDEQFLRYGDYATVSAWLHNIKGIGDWSAAFLLIRGLGRTEQISSEKHLLAAASARYQQPMTAQSLKPIAAHYGEWQGYWAFYLRASSN